MTIFIYKFQLIIRLPSRIKGKQSENGNLHLLPALVFSQVNSGLKFSSHK